MQRRSIVLAAIDSIAGLGPDGLRAAHVAHEAGTEVSAVLRQFPAESKLAAAVLEYVVDDIVASIDAQGGPASRLDRHLRALGLLIGKRPALFLVLAELEVRGRRDPLVRGAVDTAERRWRDAVATLFDAAHDPHTSAAIVVAAAKGVKFDSAGALRVLGQLGRLFDGRSGGRAG